MGDHHKNFICRRCMTSYTSEKMRKLHKPKCKNIDETKIRTSSEPNLHWKKHLYKNPLYFRIYTDSEADNEIDKSSRGNKTTNIYKRNPVLNGYHIECELNDFLKRGYYKSPLGYKNANWFKNEVVKLENKMAFFLKNTMTDIIMTKIGEEEYRNSNICRFCEENIESDKVRDHCYLTSKYRGPAQKTCKINATQKQNNFIPCPFHKFSNFDGHLFFINVS